MLDVGSSMLEIVNLILTIIDNSCKIDFVVDH